MITSDPDKIVKGDAKALTGFTNMGGNNNVSKVHLLSIIFLTVEVIAFIPLTIEVFGDMNPDVITISVIVFGAGMAGNCICTIIKAIRESKRK